MNEFSLKSYNSYTDSALLKIIGEFIKENRIRKNLKQQEVAEKADISRSTLSLLENGEPVNILSLLKVMRVLDILNLLEVFEIKSEVSPMQLAKQLENKRQRVRKDTQQDGSDW